MPEGYRNQFEAQVAQHLTQQGVTYDYEPKRISWIDAQSGAPYGYEPDFVLGNEAIIEVKGFFSRGCRMKYLSFIQQHCTQRLYLVLQRDDWIDPSTKRARYSDWCKKYDVPWCVGVPLPDAWFA